MLLALGVSASACAVGPDGGQASACEGEAIDGGSEGSGFEVCVDDTINKVGPAMCGVPTGGTCMGTEDNLGCSADSDCTERPNGVCNSFAGGFDPQSSCNCVYYCATDADCGDQQTCVCESPEGSLDYGICVYAECESNADCPSGECGVSAWNDGCGVDTSVGCRTPNDQCRVDADCDEYEQCAFSAQDGWQCVSAGCAIGRPLTGRDGAWQIAASESRDDWTHCFDALAPCPDAAAYWTEVAALEHASVASFARFTLQLMALGAPADLMADTQRAAADEVEHARLAYGLASAFAGRDLGPGPLPLCELDLATEPASVMASLVEEACVNETLGAIEARFAADACPDPVVSAVLFRIAEDELRHAQLAWRSLKWLVATHPSLRDAAHEIYRRCAARARARTADPRTMQAHPYLGRERLAAIHQAALQQVIRPAFEAAQDADAGAGAGAQRGLGFDELSAG